MRTSKANDYSRLSLFVLGIIMVIISVFPIKIPGKAINFVCANFKYGKLIDLLPKQQPQPQPQPVRHQVYNSVMNNMFTPQRG